MGIDQVKQALLVHTWSNLQLIGRSGILIKVGNGFELVELKPIKVKTNSEDVEDDSWKLHGLIKLYRHYMHIFGLIQMIGTVIVL